MHGSIASIVGTPADPLHLQNGMPISIKFSMGRTGAG
eukprot:SAG31_NODE_18779_length_623_cov_0.805344_2_plen_36_part_01